MITKIWRKKKWKFYHALENAIWSLDIESLDSKTVCLCQDTILYNIKRQNSNSNEYLNIRTSLFNLLLNPGESEW